MNSTYRRTELDQGTLVLTESIAGLRSVSLGVWVRSGSAHERADELGISHMLEHMVFKGTARRGPRELALVLERLGGSLDAYTTREHTSFQARVLDEHTEVALDVLSDLVLAPTLRAADLDLEREVVLEEIAAVEDTPDDLIFDLHASRLWGGHPYGHSILGSRESVSAQGVEALRCRHAKEYNAANLVIGAAGSLDHAELVGAVERLFRNAPAGAQSGDVAPAPPSTSGRAIIERDSAQTHLVFGTRTFPHRDERRFALLLLSTALGGGMSSRLFQRVREDLGLAYSVHTFQSFYRCGGLVGVYVGTRPEWADRAEEVVVAELARVARDGMGAEELDDAKGYVKGQIVLSTESTATRLHRMIGATLYDEPYRPVEQVLQDFDAVTQDDIAAVASEFFRPDRHTIVRLGPTG